ncbi:MAG: Unknown protein [uncultured Sulfurovum sp.]|uniref:Uncharacterized protein n=1 Tax=uncultured Sulfurovum sp. TaxID=269237 RepID=A0A6S6S893_9BACT|nr:MAG: Unknown protein [uncultured Sulfurovum sp.]
MKITQKIGVILSLLTTLAMANEELAKEIKYIGNDGAETKNQIICTNGNEAFVYSHNTSREIRVEVDGSSENLGRVTLDEVVEQVCQ